MVLFLLKVLEFSGWDTMVVPLVVYIVPMSDVCLVRMDVVSERFTPRLMHWYEVQPISNPWIIQQRDPLPWGLLSIPPLTPA